MNRLFILFFIAVATSGCTTLSPDRYHVSMSVNQSLRQYNGTHAYIASMVPVSEFNADCRGTVPIKFLDDETINRFIKNAFNDELRFANIYDEEGRRLNGQLDKAMFSSSSGLINGWWDLAITLTDPQGKSLSVENKYSFESGFDGRTACDRTAQALVPAVQDLIEKVVTHPEFAELIK